MWVFTVFIKALLIAFSISYAFTVSVQTGTIVNNTIRKRSPELIFSGKSCSHTYTAVNALAEFIARSCFSQQVLLLFQAVAAS